MDRRSFLKCLGLGAVAVATPKFIFDMGANLYKRQPLVGEVGTFGGIDIIRTKIEIANCNNLYSKLWEEQLFDSLIAPSYFVRVIEASEVDLIKQELQ